MPVDQGQRHLGVVAQLGRQAQGDVQPGIARPGDHDPAAAAGGGYIHGVLAVSIGIELSPWLAIRTHLPRRGFEPPTTPHRGSYRVREVAH
jgi:hypothetical protein